MPRILDDERVGFHADIANLLQGQLARQPERQDLRMQLLEVYSDSGKIDAFLREATQYRAYQTSGSGGTPMDWPRIASMGRRLLPLHPLFTAPAEPPAGEGAARGAGGARKGQAFRRFGDSEQAKAPLQQLAQEYAQVQQDPAFMNELDIELVHFVGRPASLLPARRLSAQGGAQIYIKREDQAWQAPHLPIHILGQALLARRLGRTKLVAATANGRKGQVIASIAAHVGLDLVLYVDAQMAERESGSTFQMRLMGAKVKPVDSGRFHNNDIREAALEHWLREPSNSLMLMGLDAGPHPYPTLAMDLAAAIGRETVRQIKAQAKKLPNMVVTRGGQCPDAIGLFQPFLRDPPTRLVCVEPAGDPYQAAASPVEDLHAGRFGSPSILYEPTQIKRAAALLDGMEYPSVTREHSWLRATGRVEYQTIPTTAALNAIHDLSSKEGIVPALNSAHAVAWACRTAKTMPPDQVVIVMLSEHSEKDERQIRQLLGHIE